MRIEQEFTVAVPIDRMFREMNDIGDIGYCIAGVKRVEVLDETNSRWVIEARAGFMARTFYLDGRIVERRPPNYLSFAGGGPDTKVEGFFELTPVNAGETKCRAVVEGEVTGPFATIVDLMAKGPQQQLIAQTIDNVRKRLEAVAAGAETETLRAEAMAEAAARRGPIEKLISQLMVWLRRLFPFLGRDKDSSKGHPA